MLPVSVTDELDGLFEPPHRITKKGAWSCHAPFAFDHFTSRSLPTAHTPYEDGSYCAREGMPFEGRPVDFRLELFTFDGRLFREVEYRERTQVARGDIAKTLPEIPAWILRRQETEKTSLDFAWRIAKYVKSNAIVLSRGRQTVGIGAGQMSRIDSIKIASIKMKQAKLDVGESLVMASDAFFPFRDVVDEAAKIGVTAIVQPGGSIRDEDSIKAADEHGIAMVFTGVRHFKH
jgi:hypothetical protein